MNKNAVMALDAQYYLPVFARYPIVLERGEGPYVYDNEGKKYLDFLAGIAVNLLGHGHPGLVKAVAEQGGLQVLDFCEGYVDQPKPAMRQAVCALRP